MRDPTLFQYCQKIVLLRHDGAEVLLARRTGEADYNQTYALIGGKLEITDGSILEGLQREKNEEIGRSVRINVCPFLSYNVYYVKKDGQHMIVPHYYAEYLGGKIHLSDEYDDFTWIPVEKLVTFEPKVENIPEVVEWANSLKVSLKPQDLVEI